MLLVWGATRLFGFYHKMSKISIHAPRVGERPQEPPQRPTATTFQYTLPVWGATKRADYLQGLADISIHAPRVGSDVVVPAPGKLCRISIHAPRVGSDYRKCVCPGAGWRFQSTLPVWGATKIFRVNGEDFGFQSTLPVWGATLY